MHSRPQGYQASTYTPNDISNNLTNVRNAEFEYREAAQQAGEVPVDGANYKAKNLHNKNLQDFKSRSNMEKETKPVKIVVKKIDPNSIDLS